MKHHSDCSNNGADLGHCLSPKRVLNWLAETVERLTFRWRIALHPGKISILRGGDYIIHCYSPFLEHMQTEDVSDFGISVFTISFTHLQLGTLRVNMGRYKVELRHCSEVFAW